MNSDFPPSTDRRHFLKTAGVASLGAIVVQPCLVSAADEAIILETKIISQQPEFYHGWSTLARRDDGELWLTWSRTCVPSDRSTQ